MRAAGLLMLVVSVSAVALDSDRPIGQNCNLSAPPNAAGESWNHGEVYRIFPRAKDIDARYSGCQAMFRGPVKGKWDAGMVIEVVDGDPVRVWYEGMTAERAACRYKDGKVVAGDAKACSGIVKLWKSVPAGCTKIIREWSAKNENGGNHPPCYKFE